MSVKLHQNQGAILFPQVSDNQIWLQLLQYMIPGVVPGKLLEGAKVPRGSREQCSLAGVQGVEPLGGGQGAKAPEADAFRTKILIKTLSEHVFSC